MAIMHLDVCDIKDIIKRKCKLNNMLPQMRIHWFIPFIVLIINMKSTRIISLTIHIMLVAERRKIINLFDNDLYFVKG